MSKKADLGSEPEMREEYDFSNAVRGKYAGPFAEGSNVIVLDPDVAEVFSDPAAVNGALRRLAKSARRSEKASSTWRNVMAGKKKALFSKTSIEALAQDKPVVYKIRNRNGTHTYTGVAKKGRVTDRLKEHLPGGPDPIPGAASVEIKQMNSIDEAREAEARSIKRSKPKHNKVGK